MACVLTVGQLPRQPVVALRAIDNHHPSDKSLTSTSAYTRDFYAGYSWGIYPGYYPTKNFVSSVGHSYPYLEILEFLYDIHTCTRNFWKFCTLVATKPGVRVQHGLYPLGTSVSSVRLCHNIRNFCKFRRTSVTVPGTSVSSVRSSYPYPELL